MAEQTSKADRVKLNRELAQMLKGGVIMDVTTPEQARIAEEFSYSRQTVNSALKTLEARGLVELASSEGDRRAKVVSLTPEGRAFADEHIVPAIEAEDRAFGTLLPEERAEFLRLADAYARAIDDELTRLRERGATE